MLIGFGARESPGVGLSRCCLFVLELVNLLASVYQETLSSFECLKVLSEQYIPFPGVVRCRKEKTLLILSFLWFLIGQLACAYRYCGSVATIDSGTFRRFFALSGKTAISPQIFFGGSVLFMRAL